MELTGRSALVTGGAIRVGREIALELGRAGMRVVVHYRTSGDAARDTAADLARIGAESDLVAGDLGVAADAERIAAAHADADLLVNSASIFPRTPLGEVDAETFDRIFAVNVRGPFLLAQRIGLAMKERGGGVIVNVADWSALRPYKGYLPYCMSKAALVAMTKGLAKALAPEVRVNTVAPGPVMLPEDMSDAERETVLGSTPLRREGSPTDVAKAVRFLAEGSDFVTGAFLTVDGGRLIA
jgi:NAD(P)-dependent dehydrogenase (short-subunit alcohol dehydrogenase family)